MTSKVLGFKENDLECMLDFADIKKIMKYQVPVVSLEWLKKFCKETGDYVDCYDLLLAAKKEASK